MNQWVIVKGQRSCSDAVCRLVPYRFASAEEQRDILIPQRISAMP
jgi:hypothetical protein